MSSKLSINEVITTGYAKPSKYNVYIFDNETTPRNFVKSLLQEIFNHNDAASEMLLSKIEAEGLATVGTYYYEIAEQKITESVFASQKAGFNLELTLDNA